MYIGTNKQESDWREEAYGSHGFPVLFSDHAYSEGISAHGMEFCSI